MKFKVFYNLNQMTDENGNVIVLQFGDYASKRHKKLIEAAPELLEALQTIIEQETIYPHLKIIADAAIKKATSL